MPELTLSCRIRSTPFTPRVEAAGVTAYTVYNHMLLPTSFGDSVAEYHHLKRAVQVWDVACERQVELVGPDAGQLAQLMTPRDLSEMYIGQSLYTPTCDRQGRVLNDPLTIKLAEDRYWVSVADTDVILFAKGLAEGRRMNVSVEEPDISPLAVQGPKSDDLMAAVFGDGIRETAFFGSQSHPFGGRTHLIARSGYSVQGGFEIYLDGSHLGLALWDRLMEAGAELDVRAGCPNTIERVEGGLLSFGSDITPHHTLAESGLDRFCRKISPDFIGVDAVQAHAKAGPARQVRYLTVDGDPVSGVTAPLAITKGNSFAGTISSMIWSPDYRTNVAIGMIEAEHWDDGTRLHAYVDGTVRNVQVFRKPASAALPLARVA